MPVGTSFENSALKSSFSLSSLQPSESTPEKGIVKPRLFSSLTKNRVKATAIRRSWGSTASEHREEFWSALQANYNYIMDNQLIDKCQETDNDLNADPGTWSLNEFYAQFSELYLWLNSVQEMIYGKEENITDKALRANCVDMVEEKSPLLALFNEQASQLVQFHPKVQEEVGWRLSHLNSKWDTILSILGPSECEHCDQDSCLDIEHEIKCLRKWFKVVESCLQPLNFRTKYTKTEIEAKGLELKVLHRDIENHGKIVGSVVKLCRRPDASCNTVNVRRIANGLERRWHLLFLRSLEWQCYLESLSKKDNCRNASTSSEDSDGDCYEEPAKKYPRLSDNDITFRSANCQEEDEFNDIRFSPMITDDVMSTKAPPTGSVDVVDGHTHKTGEDTSQFTRSNRRAPNLATYYFKHEDTDSDMDRIEQISIKTEAQSTLESEDEDEWTYTRNDEQFPIKAKPLAEETIRELVLKAEQLVSPDKSRQMGPINKMSQVKQWLSMDKPEDSCDASGEDDEKESHVSEDFDESTTTCRVSQNTSFTELHNESTPKIILRQRKYTGNRPWSVSCLSQLDQSSATKVSDNDITNFSISESALHTLSFPSKQLERLNATSANNFGHNGNNSTSSTMEESCPIVQEKASPNRRRRLKLKKKSGKFDANNSAIFNQKARSSIMKSGSFSGCSSRKLSYNERNISSDPADVHLFHQSKYVSSTTSGADSEDDAYKRVPSFKLGSKTHYLINPQKDSSLGKATATEEKSSSLSEQAEWDSFQEKYLSEAYSETHDSDAARRLLDFGEDYRNFIDSQSDWSSTNPDFSPSFRRRTLMTDIQQVGEDSDSDTESLRKIFTDSEDQLNYVKTVYKQQFNLGVNNYLIANEINEMIKTCDRHIGVLNNVERSSDEFAMSKKDKRMASELLAQWQSLRRCVLTMREYRELQKQLLVLKENLTGIDIAGPDAAIDITSVDDLPQEVEYCEKKLEDINEYKKKLLQLNVAVHRFVVENDDYNASSLKTDISDLYRIWDGVHTNTTERLNQLRPLLQAWKTLENRLDQLQVDLRGDEKTLHLLDTALQGGVLSDQTASYVRDVAKLLSETTTIQGCKLPELFTEGGSLSDSGISDEGSEHEIGERQRRLAAIRRLVRQFEVVLAPDCQARITMAEKLNAAEEELKALQKQCRSLIVCTAAYSTPTRSSVVEADNGDANDEPTSGVEPDGGDDPGNETTSSSWFKRVMRASIPFQVVIITLLCVACLLEPQCCDNMNNFAMSLSPQLRYIKGPPPI